MDSFRYAEFLFANFASVLSYLSIFFAERTPQQLFGYPGISAEFFVLLFFYIELHPTYLQTLSSSMSKSSTFLNNYVDASCLCCHPQIGGGKTSHSRSDELLVVTRFC